MPSFRVLQIDHVELFVPDRREAAAWYQRVLGLEVVPHYDQWEADPRGPLMVPSDGGSTKLALFAGPVRSGETVGFHLVAFRVDARGFLEFLDRAGDLGLLDRHGQTMTRKSAVDHDQAFSVYFSDPYGHQLEVTTYDHALVRGLLNQG